MAVPDYESLMLPTLQVQADGKEHSTPETAAALVPILGLTAEDLKQRVPSGKKLLLYDRIYWATFYMWKARLVDRTRRGYYRIMQRGLDVLADKPAKLDDEYLSRFDEFRQFHVPSPRPRPNGGTPPPIRSDKETPEERLRLAYQELTEALAAELLQKVRECSPAFFERLVVRLLVKMGYGGSEEDIVQAVGGSGDEGVDGVIKEDALGLDVIYVQAKRWDSTVGRPQANAFVGALMGQHARKGVIITTSKFTNDAINYVKSVDPKVILVDGEMLARLMIQYGVGVSVTEAYEVKRVDSDYFVEE